MQYYVQSNAQLICSKQKYSLFVLVAVVVSLKVFDRDSMCTQIVQFADNPLPTRIRGCGQYILIFKHIVSC